MPEGLNGFFKGPDTTTARDASLEPLPVICWDWTEASALQANARAMTAIAVGSYLVSPGAQGLRPQSPHVEYNWVSHFSSAGSTSFPV